MPQAAALARLARPLRNAWFVVLIVAPFAYGFAGTDQAISATSLALALHLLVA